MTETLSRVQTMEENSSDTYSKVDHLTRRMYQQATEIISIVTCVQKQTKQIASIQKAQIVLQEQQKE